MKAIDIQLNKVDQLGMLLAQIADLEKQADIIKNELKQNEGHIEGNLFGVHLRFRWSSVEQCRRLLFKLVNRLLASAGNRLVSTYIDARDAYRIVDGF